MQQHHSFFFTDLLRPISCVKPCLDEYVDNCKILPSIVEDFVLNNATKVAIFHSPSVMLLAVASDVFDTEKSIAQVWIVRRERLSFVAATSSARGRQ